jgi:hypothetical protein
MGRLSDAGWRSRRDIVYQEHRPVPTGQDML